MQDFEYSLAVSLDEAIWLLNREPGAAHPLCGGTDLLVQLREGRRIARLLVDVKAIPELNELTFDPQGGLRIGAAVPCWRIRCSAAVVEHYPGLLDAIALIGGIQIQGRASLGGNLSNASPAADSPPALIVHQAMCVAFGPAGTREIPVEDFCKAPGRTALAPGELLIAIRVPPPSAGFGAAYLRFTPRNEMDIAVAGAGASLVLDPTRRTISAARVALSAVAPTPLFVPEAGGILVGRFPSEDVFSEAARIAQAAARPITDLRGTAVQRKHLVGVLTRRALAKALERATTAARPSVG